MSVEASDDPLIGATIAGRFRPVELLGVGGMGRVYLATQISVDRPIALKVLHDEVGDTLVARERFMREAQTVANIAHPGVVQLVDFGRDAERDLLFLAMEFVEGVSLSSVMKLGPLRLRVALDIARQIAAALAQAHRAGIVHRDLKPDNVMLVATADGSLRVKVLDFGIALPQSDETRLTATGAIVGTPHYMSPEQAQDQPVGPETDLYALGVILFEMIAGRLPFSADTPLALLFKHVREIPVRVGEFRDVPDDVEAIVAGLLEKSPSNRPPSAGILAADLAAIEQGLVDERPVTLEIGSTSPRTFLPLVEVGTAPSEATDVFGATADSAPHGLRESTETAEDLDEARKQTREEVEAEVWESASGAHSRSRVPAWIAAVVLLVMIGSALGAYLALRDDPVSSQESERSSRPVAQEIEAPVAEREPFETRSVPLVERGDAGEVAEVDGEPDSKFVGPLEVEVDAREAPEDPDDPPVADATEPPDAPDKLAEPVVADAPDSPDTPVADRPEEAAPTAPPDDAVTRIGKRVDDVEIPTKARKKSSSKSPPRIPPPTDEDTLARRMRRLGGMCTGEKKCQFDGLEKPGSAVCKDDSTCVARCPIGGCIQFCQDRATCYFSCEGGRCNRMIGPDATMFEFED